MKRGKWYRTRKGQAAALWKRHLRRFMLTVDQQPQSKNIRPADAVAFQHEVLQQLEQFGRSAYTGPVFLQLEFFITSKSPPAIYKLPKNYLDLLETPRTNSDIARGSLLYRNDRQVKALVVRYHLDAPLEEPQIWVTAEPLRDFLADVDLVRCVGDEDFEPDEWWQHSYRNNDIGPDPFNTDDSWEDDALEDLVHFERKKDQWMRFWGRDAYEAQRHMMRMKAQQDHLRRTDQFTCRGLLHVFQGYVRTKGRPHGDLMKRLASTTRDMTLAAPFVLELHHAPHREGDTNMFVSTLRKALEQFKNRYPLLFPLSCLMNVTILMVPPEGGGKDLDNLARLILPSLHEIWAPPSHIAHTFNIANVQDKEMRAYWEAVRATLPKEPKYSIIEYRAFELPRFADDPKDGFVRLAVGGGMDLIRFREEIDNYLDRWRTSLRH